MTDLRDYARGEDCEIRLVGICNFDPLTTVLAHFRSNGISGAGMKSPDLLGAHACSACHSYCDTHHDIDTKLSFLLGVIRTQAKLIKREIVKW